MSDDDRDNDIESDADKRAHHNALERKRRDHIKDSFSSLRDALPSLTGEKSLQNQSAEQAKNSRGHSADANSSKEKASRAQILKKAADYIQSMRRKNSAHQQDIEDLKRQNKLLEEQIRSLEKAKTTGYYATSPVIDSSHLNSKGGSIAAFDEASDSESSDTEGSKDAGRKRLKTEPSFRP